MKPVLCLVAVVLFVATASGQTLIDEVGQAMQEASGFDQFGQTLPGMSWLSYLEGQNQSISDENSAVIDDEPDSHGLEGDGDVPSVISRLGSRDAQSKLFGPAGVMGVRHHVKGEFTMSYRYMLQAMNGSRDGDSKISDTDVRASGFPVVPTDLTVQTHMFGAMYAPTDWVTVTLLVPYFRKDLKQKAGTPLGQVRSETASEGIGDIELSGLFSLAQQGPHHLHVNAGLSLPSGAIGTKDSTPIGRVELPYLMRLGSGTVDLLPGITYTYDGQGLAWGGQFAGTVRLGRNGSEYSLGDQLHGTAWATYHWHDSLSTSVRLNYEQWGNIDGADPDLNPNLVQIADPDRQGGQRFDLLLGIDLAGQHGSLEGHRLSIEGGIPVYQKLEGPQLEVDWFLVANWQYRF